MKGINKLFNLYSRQSEITEEAKKRAMIVDFFKKHGLEATKDAFGICRSTIYRWKKLLEDSGGRLESLNDISRAPDNKKASEIDTKIIDFIKGIRKQWPRLGKQKIKPLLDQYCWQEDIRSVSISTIGRIIKRYNLFFYVKKRKKRVIAANKKLRRGRYTPQDPGDLVQIDTIVLFDFNIKRYLITAIDLVSRFVFAYCYKSASSRNARDFMMKLDKVAPFKVGRVQTDNGSEFAKNFEQYIQESGRVHYVNYPKSPRMNAFVERFNRSIQEEFVNVKEVDPYYNIDGFNRELMKYLLFYNTQRVHSSIGFMVPLMYVVRHSFSRKSNMYWTCTFS